MTKEEIKAIEEAYAKTEDTGCVPTNSAHRWTPDVPMVVPEINADHFDVIPDQKKRSWNNTRIHCSKAELLDPELCALPCSMEGIRTERAGRYNIPGNLRCRKDFQRLAGNGREHYSLHWRRGREE